MDYFQSNDDDNDDKDYESAIFVILIKKDDKYDNPTSCPLTSEV